MVKATLRSAVLLGLLAWSVPVFAEVQNVKVSGDITVRAFYRKNLRLSEDVFNGTGSYGATCAAATANQVSNVGCGTAPQFGSSGDEFFQQTTGLNVNADLTENVSTEVRFLTQKLWTGLATNALNAAVTDAGSAVVMSRANVTLKELFYAPLTLKIGRQALWFGKGFIVGNRTVNGDLDPGNYLAADEFSEQNGFDAIRTTLDLSNVGGMPLMVDGVYAKVNERLVSGSNSGGSPADDLNLLGLNVGTKFSQWNSEAEAYYWNKRDNGNNPLATSRKRSQANTIGLRGSLSPVSGSLIWSELAYQWGRRITSAITFDAEGGTADGYKALAANIGADYTAKGVAWTPTVGGEWIYFSGARAGGTAIAGWDPVFRGSFKTLLREFQAAGYYMPAQSGATLNGTYNNITNSTTNQSQLALHATVKPLEDLSVDNRLTWFTAPVGIRPTVNAKRKSYIGSEWDVQANYNYTDDVQLGLVYGIFWPGDVFRNPYDDIAQELVSSVSVKF